MRSGKLETPTSWMFDDKLKGLVVKNNPYPVQSLAWKMIEDEIERVEHVSPDLVAEQTEQLKHIFPQVFSEGKIDFKKLRAALGDAVDTQPERYSFTWAGKRDATLLLQSPSYGTLTPAEDESINYESTQNLFIEGDNLEVLKLLYKSYSGLVKMIYIDPPYNTGNDFVYTDNYADPLETYLEITGQKDTNGNLLTSNPETSGRYHSAWLSMMYPRLYIARQLLRDDGAIFISIDDNEVHNLRMIMNEIFGEENFLGMLARKTKSGGGSAAHHFAIEHDYVVVYAKNASELGPLFIKHDVEYLKRYSEQDDKGKYFWDTFERSYTQTKPYEIEAPDGTMLQGSWFRSEGRFADDLAAGEMRFIKNKSGNWSVQFKQRLAEGMKLRSLLTDNRFKSSQEDLQELGMKDIFSYPKPVGLIRVLAEACTKHNDIVLDFFAGSCTTAQAVIDLNREDNGNRRFIMIQLPERTDNPELPTIAEIGKERIRRVITKMKLEDAGKLNLSTRKNPEDLGFRVFKLRQSNYKQWKNVAGEDAEAYTEQLTFFTDPLVENWVPENVLWEVAIKEGYGLNAYFERLEKVQDNRVWRISDPDKKQSLLVCLDDRLEQSTLSVLPLTRDQVFVCLNKALNDTLAANLALQCRLKKI